MNFIINLFNLYNYNVILTVMCRLLKERHYISCITDDEDITVEKTAEMLLQWVYQTHDLSSFIVFDRDSQFIFILWKSFCKWLSISLWLFIIYYFQIDDQSEWVNQNVKRYLHFFCLYMQNNWFKWLLMIEFVNNNILSSVIFLIFFFMNKNFYSHMSFDFDIIEYESIRERLQITQVEDIFDHMNKTLIFAREALIKTWEQMMNQTNKHKKRINYEIESKMFLDWSSSWVLNWHFELKSISSWVAHIFNSIQVKLLIFSTWRDSTQLRIESIQLNLSRTQAWRQES